MSKNKIKHDDIFADVYAGTKSPIQAMIASEPHLADRRPYAATKANRMLKRPDIQEKIQKKLEKMHTKATKQIDKLIMSDDESIATQNSWRVIEQLRGKPVARNLNVNAQVNIEDALFD